MTNGPSTWRAAVRGALALFVLGMAGVIALAAHTVPTLRAFPELAVLSDPMLMAIAAANSTIIPVVFTVLGAVSVGVILLL